MGLPAESLALQLARTDQERRRVWKLCYVERHITVKTNHQVVNQTLHVCMFFLILNNEKKLCYDFMKVNLSMIMKSELIIAKAMM